MLGYFTGMRVFVSKHAYKTKTVVRGIADSRRSNRVKPLYRRVTIHIPLIFRMGNDIICAPELEQQIKRQVAQTFSPD